jgi:molybdate transport repressor ModE-like protein
MNVADGWEALEVRHLRALAAVIEEGSFAGAARALGYTQSAVSQQIFALERIVGAPVLSRHPGGRRPAELTEAGEVVLAHARSLLARVQAAQADVAALALGEIGQLAIGTFQSFGTRILPGLLARFRSLHPGVIVDIRESTDVYELLAGVERGEIDVSFAVLPLPVGPFASRELLEDEYVLVTRAGGAERSLADLGGRHALFSCAFEQRLVAGHLQAAGVVAAACSRFDDNGMIQALAGAGEGVAVVPSLTIDQSDDRIDVHPLAELQPRRVVAVWHENRQLNGAAGDFVKAAAEQTDQLF